MQNVFLIKNKMEEDFNITDHIIELPDGGSKESWTTNTYELKKGYYDITDIHDPSYIKKSNTPWYRRFENNRKNKKKK